MKGSASAAMTQVGTLPGAPQIPGMIAEAPVMADLDGDGNQDVVIAYDNASADHAHPVAAATNVITSGMEGLMGRMTRR
jgi:hypothetical protein